MLDLQRIADWIEYEVWTHPSYHKPTIVASVTKRILLKGEQGELGRIELKVSVSQMYNIMTRGQKLAPLRKRARTSLESLKEAR